MRESFTVAALFAFYPSNNNSFTGPDGDKIFFISLVLVSVMLWFLLRGKK
jgi:hypothetical protein